jgi:hypothetical protein
MPVPGSPIPQNLQTFHDPFFKSWATRRSLGFDMASTYAISDRRVTVSGSQISPVAQFTSQRNGLWVLVELYADLFSVFGILERHLSVQHAYASSSLVLPYVAPKCPEAGEKAISALFEIGHLR